MEFISRIRPNYRDKISTMRIMIDLTIALVVLTIASIIYYTNKVSIEVGLRVLYVVLTAVVVNIVLEVLIGYFQKRSVKEIFTQQFPWVTGLILALCIPLTTRLYVVGMTTAIAVIFGKVIFGGFGQNIFNPAGVGRAIVGSAFTGAFLSTFDKTNDVFTNATPANLMNSFSWLPTDAAFESKAFAHMQLQDFAMGNHFGSIGETFSLLIIILGIFLVIRKVIDWRIPVVYIGTLFVASMIVGLVAGVGLWYPLAFVMSGGALFGAVFMLTDPVTCPTQRTGKVVFAMGAAIITFLIRFKGNAPEGVVFSILIMNMLTPMIEDFFDGQQTRLKSKYLYSTLAMLALVGLSVVWVTTTTKAELPKLDLGEPVALTQEGVDRYKVDSIEMTEEGGNKVFTVSVQGYGLRDAEFPSPDYKENIFVVTVDSSNKIVAAEMSQFGDTAGIGDVVDDDLYFETFIGKDLSNDSESYDVVSEATKTSYSFLRALQAITEELGA